MEHATRRRCTKEEVLVDYLEGHLSEGERLKVEQHLSGCDACLEELVIAGKRDTFSFSLGVEPVPERVTRRAVETIKVLSRESLFDRISAYIHPLVSKGRDVFFRPWPRMRPSLAPVRGSKTVLADDLILLRKTFLDLDADIEIEKIGVDRASIFVRLPNGDEPENPIRVTLLKKGREMSSSLCVGQMTSFEGVPFGRYTLTFSRDGVKIGEYAFIIKENPHGSGQKQ